MPPAPLASILRALGSRHPYRRRAAVIALCRRDDAAAAHADRLLAAIRDPDEDVREAAVRSLRRVKPDAPALLDALAELLGDPEPRVRVYAAEVLYPHAQYAGAALGRLAEVIGVFETADARVARAAVRRLRAVGRMVRHLAGCLAGAGGVTPADAALGLSRFGPRAGRASPALVAALGGRSPRLRVAAIQALAEIGVDPAPVQAALHAVLAGDDPALRVEAAAALCRSAGSAADGVRVLVETFEGDPAGPELVKDGLMCVAGRLGPGTPVLARALARGLKSRSADTRARYGNLVGKLGKYGLRSPELVPALVGATVDDSSAVRFEAAYALARVEPFTADAVHGLISLLSDSDERVQIEAAFSLRRMGRLAIDALPALIRLRATASDYVRGMVAGEVHTLIVLSLDASQAGSLAEPPLPDAVRSRLVMLLNQETEGLKLLRAFHEIGLSRRDSICSFSRAAAALGTNRSVPKRNVDELTRHIGAGDLVKSSNRGVVLTDLGDAVWAYARRLFSGFPRGAAEGRGDQ